MSNPENVIYTVRVAEEAPVTDNGGNAGAAFFWGFLFAGIAGAACYDIGKSAGRGTARVTSTYNATLQSSNESLRQAKELLRSERDGLRSDLNKRTRECRELTLECSNRKRECAELKSTLEDTSEIVRVLDETSELTDNTRRGGTLERDLLRNLGEILRGRLALSDASSFTMEYLRFLARTVSVPAGVGFNEVKDELRKAVASFGTPIRISAVLLVQTWRVMRMYPQSRLLQLHNNR